MPVAAPVPMKCAKTDVELADPWFVDAGVFAASKPGETHYLDILDILPADAKDARAVVTYAREGTGPVALAGASLVFDRPEDYGDPASDVTPKAQRERVGLLWQAEEELRKAPAIARGVLRDLRRMLDERRVPVSALSGAFAAGIVVAIISSVVF